MPVDVLKIDMVFLRRETAGARAIVRQMIALICGLEGITAKEGPCIAGPLPRTYPFPSL